MLRFCVYFAHLHHAYQHFMYFLGRKISKIDIKYTLWGIYLIASYSSEKAWVNFFVLSKEKSEKFSPERRFLYFFSWIIS